MQVATGNVMKASADDCGFGYRRSIFNSGIGDNLIILQIELALSRLARLDLRYPDVRDYFKERGVGSRFATPSSRFATASSPSRAKRRAATQARFSRT